MIARVLLFAILFLLILIENSYATKIAIEPGNYKCDSVSDNSETLHGTCIYNAKKGNGPQVLESLVRLAREMVKVDLGLPNIIRPHVFNKDKGEILWWLGNDKDNQKIGELLKDNDDADIVSRLNKIKVSIILYSFERGYDHEFGFDVAAHYKKKESSSDSEESTSGSSLGNIVDGIFSGSAVIGNPLASFINLGISAAKDKNKSISVQEDTFECRLGRSCNYEKTQDIHLDFMTGIVKDKMGVIFHGTPIFDPKNPKLIRFNHANLEYNLRTKEEKAPVLKYRPLGFETITIDPSKLHIIAGVQSSVDYIATGILKTKKTKAHTRTLILIKAEVLDPTSNEKVLKQINLMRDDKSYTQKEINLLPKNELSLKEVLNSIELVCFRDRVNPIRIDKICGFRLTRMDQKYLKYRLKFKVKGKLLYKEAAVKYHQMGDIYQSKGYYQLPQLSDSKASSKYKIIISLDKTSPLAKRRRNSERVKGLSFKIGYYPQSDDTVEFDHTSIKWKTR